MTTTATLSRRDLLARSALLTAGAGLLAGANPVFAAAAAKRDAVALKDVLAMSPVEMAKRSPVVQEAYKVLLQAASKLRDADVRKCVTALLKNPAPNFDVADEAALLNAFKREGFADDSRQAPFPTPLKEAKSVQPFWSAPGSGYGSHHAYPGGLATHVALNVISAQKLCESYDEIFQLRVDYDDAVGGEILHDIAKPWVFAWQADGSCRKEESLAGTGEHHILSIAQSIRAKLPASFVVAQACAHEHPGSEAGEKLVVGWLRCASLIAGVDPIKAGYLAADGKTLPLPRRIEGFVVHLADHDWVISSPACQWTVEALKKLARETYGLTEEKDLNAFRNFALANLTAMRLYGILSTEGEEAFAKEVARVIKA